MTRTLWRNGPVFTGAEVFPDGALLCEDGRVGWVGDRAELETRSGDEVVIDLKGRLLTPGWINAHTHIYSALARGMAIKEEAPENFVQILERLWWRLDRALELEEIALSAQLHGWECLRAGVTTIVDHHASQRVVRGSLRTISEALEPLGLRASLCYEVTDREGPEIAAAGLGENVAFLESVASDATHRRRGLFGLHAAFTVSDTTLARSVAEAKRAGAGFHLHLAEDRVDAAGAVARLEQAGVLGPDTLCVHGVHLEDADLERLAATSTWLVHCPESNLNNAVGAVRLDRLRQADVRVALGTDGFTAHVAREALVAHLAQNHLSADPGQGWQTVPPVFLEGNAELASAHFGVTLGAFSPGAAADVVQWDYRPPTPITTANLWGHLLFGLSSSRADSVWIDGRCVLEQGEATGLDEEALFAECRRAAAALWDRF